MWHRTRAKGHSPKGEGRCTTEWFAKGPGRSWNQFCSRLPIISLHIQIDLYTNRLLTNRHSVEHWRLALAFQVSSFARNSCWVSDPVWTNPCSGSPDLLSLCSPVMQETSMIPACRNVLSVLLGFQVYGMPFYFWDKNLVLTDQTLKPHRKLCSWTSQYY